MSDSDVRAISQRLSLRDPQRKSLEILHNICSQINFKSDIELDRALAIIKDEFPTVEGFERDFPSLCFALATGVGKTRLMGAFITYLYRARGVRNFFVLAPNLTIYNKLITDFTPSTSKYVFRGIREFAMDTPEIITGDTYESRGKLFDDPHQCRINIFNISKINSEVRGGKEPKIKRLSEYLGESYFDYLASLDDLVILMDESHRYRADAGLRAINELKPILGLELTATAQIEKGSKTIRFKNVIYDYPLAHAINDGFVKQPAVATRENFEAKDYSEEQIELIKLEDGVRLHEDTKVSLEVYAGNNNCKYVKPFMLIIATDTEHATRIQNKIENDDFFNGSYKNKVIQVHSNLNGKIKDEVIEQLLTVEDPDNPIEIVIHVNMLKEGWDVTNLYTIVPLRAANSKTLVEQSIGRGLRLPYGKRTGDPAVDRLTIVAHDKFQEIIDYANNPDSIIYHIEERKITEDELEHGKKLVTVKSNFERLITGEETSFTPSIFSASKEPEESKPVFNTPEEKEIARTTFEKLKPLERKVKDLSDLQKPEIQEELVKLVTESTAQGQQILEGFTEKPDTAAIVQKVTELYQNMSISIPKIVVVPSGKIENGYRDFDLNTSSINIQPVEHDILVKHLQSNDQHIIKADADFAKENKLEDYLVRGLIDYDDIDYNSQADLLYKLAGQVVNHLKSYLNSIEEVENVLLYSQRQLCEIIHNQMQPHFFESATKYEARVTRGYKTLSTCNYSCAKHEETKNFRDTITSGNKSGIQSLIFSGFRKCLYPEQKFDSDSERKFAIILEDDKAVLKWFKPARLDFAIDYSPLESYEPDFVVETENCLLICEVKRRSELDDEIVIKKANAASTWCTHATNHALENNGKPWKYLLIPHDDIKFSTSISGFIATSEYKN